MKSIIIIIVCAVTLTLSAQNPSEKTVGDFSEIKVYDLIEVHLVKSDKNSVEITGDDIENVEVVNKNGILKIRMKFNKIFNGSNTFVKVYYTKLSIIDGNEGAYISSNETFKQDHIELKAQEGAQIKIALDVNKADVKAVSGGVVETHGNANSQTINITTGGIYKGKSLETKTTNVDIKAGGEAKINASQTVNAKVRAGGTIDIYGNPQTVNESKALGGKIRIMD